MRKIFILSLLIISLAFACTACGTDDMTKNSASEFKKAESLPKNARKLLNEGIEKVKSYNINGAILDFQELTKLYPDLPIAYYNLGLAYTQNNQLKEATESWDKTITLDDNYADAYYNLGLAYKMLHNNKKARENLVEYVMLRPNDPNINSIKAEITQLNEPFSGKGIIGRISITDEADFENNTALNAKSFFNPDTKFIYTAIEIANAPKGTNMIAGWYYLTDDNQKFPVNRQKFEVEGSKNILLSIKAPKTGWPVGKYELDILMDGNINAIVPFDVLR